MSGSEAAGRFPPTPTKASYSPALPASPRAAYGKEAPLAGDFFPQQEGWELEKGFPVVASVHLLKGERPLQGWKQVRPECPVPPSSEVPGLHPLPPGAPPSTPGPRNTGSLGGHPGRAASGGALAEGGKGGCVRLSATPSATGHGGAGRPGASVIPSPGKSQLYLSSTYCVPSPMQRA